MTSQRLHWTSRRAVAIGVVVLGLTATGSAAPRPDERSSRPNPDERDETVSPAEGQWGTRAEQIAAAEQGYRVALERLASGAPEDAVDSLIAFEERFAEDASGLPSRVTERGEEEVLSRLAARDLEAVLPILLLHVDTFRRYQQQGRQPFADHHAAMATRATGHLAAGARTPEQRRAAAEPLAAIGLALLEDRRRTAAHGILLAARRIDPDNASALLGLATDREWEGDHDEVVNLLGRLVAATAPPEARLRLAVNLRRTGRHGEAAELLSSLLDEPDEEWVAQLAHQELAALRLAGGEAEDAVRLLRAGVQRFPDSEQLLLQLAYVLDRAGDPAAARSTVTELAARPTTDGAEVTPRRRYHRSPEAGPAIALPALRERAGELLPRLAASLDALAAAETGR